MSRAHVFEWSPFQFKWDVCSNLQKNVFIYHALSAQLFHLRYPTDVNAWEGQPYYFLLINPLLDKKMVNNRFLYLFSLYTMSQELLVDARSVLLPKISTLVNVSDTDKIVSDVCVIYKSALQNKMQCGVDDANFSQKLITALTHALQEDVNSTIRSNHLMNLSNPEAFIKSFKILVKKHLVTSRETCEQTIKDVRKLCKDDSKKYQIGGFRDMLFALHESEQQSSINCNESTTNNEPNTHKELRNFAWYLKHRYDGGPINEKEPSELESLRAKLIDMAKIEDLSAEKLQDYFNFIDMPITHPNKAHIEGIMVRGAKEKAFCEIREMLQAVLQKKLTEIEGAMQALKHQTEDINSVQFNENFLANLLIVQANFKKFMEKDVTSFSQNAAMVMEIHEEESVKAACAATPGFMPTPIHFCDDTRITESHHDGARKTHRRRYSE